MEFKGHRLIVVRGWVKSSSWIIAAWCDKRTEHAITLNGTGNVAHGGFSIAVPDESTKSVKTRVDPRQGAITEDDTPLPRDQCIFLSYYQIVDRAFWVTIRAKAGDHQLPPGDSGDGGNSGVYVGNEGVDVDEVRNTFPRVIMTTHDPLPYSRPMIQSTTSLITYSPW